MKARPILFSGPMVRALLDGRKTQTRRVVKPKPDIARVVSRAVFCGQSPYPLSRNDCGGYAYVQQRDGMVVGLGCPYGKPGDLLWVRETAEADHDTHEAVTLSKYAADDAPVLYPGPDKDEHGEDDYGGSIAHWWYSKDACPSLHMPRWASRLTLEITAVRVERLQDISEADKASEGGTPDKPFGTVWRAINTAPGIRWEDNPWVWVLEFKVHQCNVDEMLKRRAA